MLSRSSTRPRPGPPGRRRRPPPPRCGWRSWTRLESTAAKGANAEQLIAQLEGELLTERSRISELEQAAEVPCRGGTRAQVGRGSAGEARIDGGARVRCRVSAGDAGVGARGARDLWATRRPARRGARCRARVGARGAPERAADLGRDRTGAVRGRSGEDPCRGRGRGGVDPGGSVARGSGRPRRGFRTGRGSRLRRRHGARCPRGGRGRAEGDQEEASAAADRSERLRLELEAVKDSARARAGVDPCRAPRGARSGASHLPA